MKAILKSDSTKTSLNVVKDKNLNRRVVYHVQGLGRTLTAKEFNRFYKEI
jgi:hypothetical protein